MNEVSATGNPEGRRRALHVIPYPIIPLIGPCFRCLRQLRALKDRGMDVALLTPSIRSNNAGENLKGHLFQGIDVLPVLPNVSPAVLREIVFLLFSRPRIKRAIERVRPDVVHVHNPPDTLAFVTSLVCSSMKIPLIYDIHDSSKEVIGATEINPLLKWLYIRVALFFERQTIRRSSGIVTVSESLKKLLIRTRSVFRDYRPFFVVMRNVDQFLEQLSEKEIPDAQNYIFYSGTLYSKFIGLEFFIDGVKDYLKEADMKLYIAGDGPYRKMLEKYVSEAGLGESVKILGQVKRDEVISLIEKAKMTVIPYERNSLSEIALPNKLFEYMALGKPVIYPDFPGFREVLGEGNSGRYKPGDKDDLRRAVKNILSDNELRKSLGKKNRELLTNFSFEKEFSKLFELYRFVINRHGTRKI